MTPFKTRRLLFLWVGKGVGLPKSKKLVDLVFRKFRYFPWIRSNTKLHTYLKKGDDYIRSRHSFSVTLFDFNSTSRTSVGTHTYTHILVNYDLETVFRPSVLFHHSLSSLRLPLVSLCTSKTRTRPKSCPLYLFLCLFRKVFFSYRFQDHTRGMTDIRLRTVWSSWYIYDPFI